MTEPTQAALGAAYNFEKNAAQLEEMARDSHIRHLPTNVGNKRELMLQLYAQRLTALEYRRKALLLRGVPEDVIEACVPQEAKDRRG